MSSDDIDQIKRLPEVLKARGRGRTAHYADIERGLFTKPIAIGPQSRGWPASEVAALNKARISGMTDDEIRDLVDHLHGKRALGGDNA